MKDQLEFLGGIGLEFRKADKDDIAQLVQIRKAFLLEEFSLTEEIAGIIESRLKGYFEKHLNNDITAYVASDGGALVASAFLLVIEKPQSPSFPEGRTGTVLNVYTSPAYRRKNIASRLLEMLISDAKQMGLDFIDLKATASGYPVYKKLGFEVDESKNIPMKYRFN